MKHRKTLVALALSGALAFGMSLGLTRTARANDIISDYTITIPSTVSVSMTGEDYISIGSIAVTGAMGTNSNRFDYLDVYPSSSNGDVSSNDDYPDDGYTYWSLKSNDKSIYYYLAEYYEDPDNSSYSGYSQFNGFGVSGLSNTPKTIPLYVHIDQDSYNSAPIGVYSDTVVFTAQVLGMA